MGKIIRNEVEYHFAGPISYNPLHDHPTINGVELIGNLTLEDLGLMSAGQIPVNPESGEDPDANIWIVDDDE